VSVPGALLLALILTVLTIRLHGERSHIPAARQRKQPV
jgi:hypothetical protein